MLGICIIINTMVEDALENSKDLVTAVDDIITMIIYVIVSSCNCGQYLLNLHHAAGLLDIGHHCQYNYLMEDTFHPSPNPQSPSPIILFMT